MQIDLNEEEAELLRALLDTALRDLSHEIADTDLASYRRMLRERRSSVQRLLDAVGGPIPNAERFSAD
jgi:hypothetical protein